MILQQSIINYDFVFLLCSCKNNVLLIEMADSGEEIAREELLFSAVGNSVTIGQKVTIKCGRKKEDFYFIGAYYNEEMGEYRREDNSSLAIFLGSLQSGVQGNRKKLRDMAENVSAHDRIKLQCAKDAGASTDRSTILVSIRRRVCLR